MKSDFMASDIDGHSHDLGAVLSSGKEIALVFYQTWCQPCAREAPHVAEVARQHGERLQFYGVVSGSDEQVDNAKVRGWQQRFQLPYPQLRDRDLALTDKFSVKGTPTIIVLGCDGMILYRGHRSPNWDQLLTR